MAEDVNDCERLLDGSAVVLIADDEELMREVLAMMVEENGGHVLTAVDGNEAVTLFERRKEDIDYVFMDFSMPGLNGYEAYVEMKKFKPSIKVVFFSGLEITPEIAALAARNEVEFISKPFRGVELLNAAKRLQRHHLAKA